MTINNEIIPSENRLHYILEEIKKLSLFEIRKINNLSFKLLDDPEKILAVKAQLRVGMEITYIDFETNELTRAIILNIRKTQALVENISDKARWDIYFSIMVLDSQNNLMHNDNRRKSGNLDRYSLRIGDHVGYHSKSGMDVFGIIEKLNPKRAVVQLNNGERWNVSYPLLFLITDGVSIDNQGCLLIEGEVIR